jgi:dipeptidyl aminopeptidase/acylaminoacyl peptidase
VTDPGLRPGARGPYRRPYIAAFLLLAVVAAVLISCDDSSTDAVPSDGPIVFQTVDEGTFELAVADADGERLGRITEVPDPLNAWPTGVPGRALCMTGDGRLYLVDANDRSARRLDVPAEVGPQPPGFQFASGDRFYVLADPTQSNSYLLDAQTGEISDLADLGEEGDDFAGYGLLSPDETHLAALIGSTTFVLPTENPDDARALQGAASAPAFSDDGSMIAYLRAGDPVELVTERVNGSDSEVVGDVSGGPGQVAFTADGDSVLVTGSNGASLVPLGDRQPREVVSYDGNPLSAPLVGPGGSKALVGYEPEEEDEPAYSLVDLEEESSETQEDLGGYLLAPYRPGDRWVYFVDSFDSTTSVWSLDLDTGDSTEVLDFEGDSVAFGGFFQTSVEGRFALLSEMVEDNRDQRLWLMSAEEGDTRMVAEGETAFGVFSPSGEQVAVSTGHRTENSGSTSTLSITSTTGEESTEIGEGLRPVWLRAD